jgi:small subunit ribosomal protein S6
MRNYEISVVLHPDLEIDLENTTKKVEKIITSVDGKITNTDNWGKRKLAYQINKQDWGIYIFYTVELPPSSVRELNEKLRITEEIMRYLIVSLEDIKYLKTPNKTAKKTTKKAKEKK